MTHARPEFTAKATVRSQLREQHILWPPTAGDMLSQRVRDLVGSPLVAACYLSYAEEPPTQSLRADWRATGTRLLVPVLLPNRDLDWVLDDGHLGHGMRFNNPEGQRLGIQAVAAAEVIVVPAMAIGEDGVRLGQGGGSYDRVLSRLPRFGRTIVGLVHDERVLPAGTLPAEHHDVSVDVIVTPYRTLKVTKQH